MLHKLDPYIHQIISKYLYQKDKHNLLYLNKYLFNIWIELFCNNFSFLPEELTKLDKKYNKFVKKIYYKDEKYLFNVYPNIETVIFVSGFSTRKKLQGMTIKYSERTVISSEKEKEEEPKIDHYKPLNNIKNIVDICSF